MDDVFYGEKLRLARLLNGLTQQQLGGEISTSRQFIHQLESGARQPADDVAGALCEVLGVKPEFFFQPLGNDVKFEQVHFRKRRTTPVGLVNRVLAYSTLLEQLVSMIHKHLELPQPNFPEVSHDSEFYTSAEIEQAALDCRKLWGLGADRPISRMTRVLEAAGVVITQFDGLSAKVDALSLNRTHPIVVRNTAKESVCRLRFDLAHECGHFVLHDGIETGDKVRESEADKFASAFLFPKKAFFNEFPDFTSQKRLNWRSIYDLKVRWGMSVRAIIYRAHSLNLITAQQFRSANVYLNRTGQTKVERKDGLVPHEQPELLNNSVRALEQHFGLGMGRIADELGIEPSKLNVIAGLDAAVSKYSNSNVVPFT